MRGGGQRDSSGSRLVMEWFTRFGDFRSFLDYRADELARQREIEDGLAVPGSSFSVPGRCIVCDRDEVFETDWTYSYEVSGKLTPNWREHLRCPRCGMNNRMRATVFVFRSMIASGSGSKVYLSEQRTPVYQWFVKNVVEVSGSEFLGDDHLGGSENQAGIRHEDVTGLSFGSETFDAVVCLDVLEHVPDYAAGVREIRRVLSPGGSLVLSVPTNLGLRKNLVRAEVRSDGSIKHHEEPEYHFDPNRTEGCLAFYHFGWEILDDLREAGFVDVGIVHYWSDWLGFLGPNQILILAKTPS